MLWKDEIIIEGVFAFEGATDFVLDDGGINNAGELIGEDLLVGREPKQEVNNVILLVLLLHVLNNLSCSSLHNALSIFGRVMISGHIEILTRLTNLLLIQAQHHRLIEASTPRSRSTNHSIVLRF
jgi:hypothetical protein